MPTTSTKLRIATYNIRRDSQPNEITILQSRSALGNPLEHGKFLGMSGEYPWSTRRLRVAESLLSENINIAAFQEALQRQVNDLAELFGNGWGWVGRARSDVKEGGEYCPIFFKKSTVNLLSTDTFWLSCVPTILPPSHRKSPGGGTFPLCTMASFRLKKGSKTKFTICNDVFGASLILARARYEAVQTRRPVFVMGDFNSGKDSGAYTIITGASTPMAISSKFDKKYKVGDQLPDFKMHDLRDRAPRKKVSNNFATYTGFNKPCDTSGWKRIDFIFGGSNLVWTSRAYKVGTSLSDDGILASDHRPVFADVSI
ncbi:Endonuclease/exonuclease/phosphatase [Armillaria mellea]|nr:Endonuclease/exonuclease/phosphatase [Armillaria mellea]